MSLVRPGRWLAQITHSRRFLSTGKIRLNLEDSNNNQCIQLRQLADLDLTKAVSVIHLELLTKQGIIMPKKPVMDSRRDENATEIPEDPALLEDSKQDPSVKKSRVKIYLISIFVAIVAWFIFSPIKAPCRWIPTSAELLEASERRILNCLSTPFTSRFVNIGPVVGSKDNEIWTVSMNAKSDKLPVVLLHGFGAGIGFWVLNLDSLAKDRPVYAIDHLGFGRSSRPKFSSDPAKAERQFVDAIEEWRKRLDLDKFVLVGHSFGGYLAMSYSLTYPDSVAHLVLADAWGLPEKPENHIRNIPWYIKTLAYILRPMNPFWAIRAAGPKGPGLLERVRPDLINKFAELNDRGENVKFGEYVYHCNAQDPSGETAFQALMHDYGWSKFPLVRRLAGLPSSVDITAIYGQQSWVSRIPDEEFQQLRPNTYFKSHILENCGHHVYSDAKYEFNSIISQASILADKKQAELLQ